MPVYSYKFSGREVLAANSGSVTIPGTLSAIGNVRVTGSLLHGFQLVNNGSYNHLQGGVVQAGTAKAYYSDSNSGTVINLVAGVNATSQFTPNSIALLDDSSFEDSIGRSTYLVLSSSYTAPYTTIWFDNDVTTSELYIIGSGVPQYAFAGGGATITATAGHAEGYGAYAVGNYSHAEGVYSTALGDHSHTEGSETVAASVAHAEGLQTRAYGPYSHTEGYGTVTKGAYQTAIGQFNATSSVNSSFIIGNGTSNSARSTLFQTSGSTVQITGSLNVLLTDAAGAGGTTARILSYAPSPYGIVFRGYSSGVHSIQVQRSANDGEQFGLTLQPLGGNVGVKTTSPSYPLHVSGSVSNTSIYATHDIVAYSDASVKENIRPIENVIERIQQSRGILYDRIDNNVKNNIGFIAQELEVAFPELVVTNEDGTKAVKYQNTVAVLFEAIKAQQRQIDELKQIVDGINR